MQKGNKMFLIGVHKPIGNNYRVSTDTYFFSSCMGWNW